jgi:hypothetical protein
VIDAELPPGPPDRALTRGFAACLASVTETPIAELPLPDADLPEALGTWRAWLAGHGAGLVPIADPDRFQWAGWWIATVGAGPTTLGSEPADVAVLAFGTPPGIVLSPQDPTMIGRATADLPLTGAFAVASLDPTLRPAPAFPDLQGTVEALAIAAAAEADMQRVDVARALPGRGLEGDRYAVHAGTFSPRTGHRPGYDLTLIAAEVLDQLAGDGDPVGFLATRRNILTRGIDLDTLVGRSFTIGDVRCYGRRRCEPCAHLEQLHGPGLLRPLIHGGGLRADLLTGGTIEVGAPIRALPRDRATPS